jgi:hypothetical protein
MAKAESSKAAASNAIRANTAGAGTVYELPWYAPLLENLSPTYLHSPVHLLLALPIGYSDAHGLPG